MIKSLPLFLICCVLMTSLLTNAQHWNWANSMGDTTANTVTKAISMYLEKDILIAGTYSSKTLELGHFSLKNSGREDAFLALLDSSGNYLWSTSYGGGSTETATALATDASGNIYLAGTFTSLTLDFENHKLTNKGERDGFIVKIDNEKKVVWAFGYGGLGDDVISSIAVDATGNVFASTYTYNYQTNEFYIFTFKLDPDKNILWQQKASSNGYYLVSNSLVLDIDQNCYVSGGFNQDLNFGQNHKITSNEIGEPPYTSFQNSGYIAKYNSVGEFQHAVVIDSFSATTAMVYSRDYLFLSGEKINYGWGWGWPLSDSKICLAKYNLELTPVWLKSTGGEEMNQSLDIANAMSADELGNIYQTGYFFSDAVKFGTDSLRNIYNKEYYYQQMFIFKYDFDGHELWGKEFGKLQCDVGTCIQAVANDKFYVSGTFESNSIEFGQFELFNTDVITEAYVHLRPPRETRNTLAFVARFSNVANGVHDNGPSKLAKVFPNPVSDNVTILLNSNIIIDGELELYSIDGRLIKRQSINTGQKQIELNTNYLKTGTYIIKLFVDHEVSVHKIHKN